MSTLMELTMIPLDKGPHFSKYVAGSLDIIDGSGLDYVLTPMGTIIEGNFGDLLNLLTRCFDNLKTESDRISIGVKFDHRSGKDNRLRGKTQSVEEKLGRTLNTTFS